MTITKLLMTFILLYSASSLGAVYKCTDANGRVMYSDTACDNKVDRQAVELKPLAEITAHQPFFANISEKIQRFFKKFSNDQPSVIPPSPPAIAPTTQLSRFQCDGRTHCSQMTSCEEATFFINNCPDTEMDGNNDGVPCEKQWCR